MHSLCNVCSYQYNVCTLCVMSVVISIMYAGTLSMYHIMVICEIQHLTAIKLSSVGFLLYNCTRSRRRVGTRKRVSVSASTIASTVQPICVCILLLIVAPIAIPEGKERFVPLSTFKRVSCPHRYTCTVCSNRSTVFCTISDSAHT